MARKNSVHARYRPIKVIMTDGAEIEMKSTYDVSDVLHLNIDKLTHPAWTKKVGHVNQNVSQIAKFHERFGKLDISAKSGGK